MEDSSDSNGEGNGDPHTNRELYTSNSNSNYKRQVYLEFSEFSAAQIKKIEDIFNQYVIIPETIYNFVILFYLSAINNRFIQR